MITNDQETMIGLVILGIAALIGVYIMGRADGNYAGRNEAWELSKQWKCEAKFNDVPRMEITGECLKYFEGVK